MSVEWIGTRPCVRVGKRAMEFLLLTTVIENASVRLPD
jgi:hypothetical protein